MNEDDFTFQSHCFVVHTAAAVSSATIHVSWLLISCNCRVKNVTSFEKSDSQCMII